MVSDIAKLNDSFRRTFDGGKLVITSGIDTKSDEEVGSILERIQSFNIFTEENDPYGDHDFGSLESKGDKVYWKIDYYDENMEYGSPDPANPEVTTRVLTIMLASEY